MSFFRIERDEANDVRYLWIGRLKFLILSHTGPSQRGGPMVNVDGTPMFGNVDAGGNPFGVTTRHDQQ